MSNEEIYKQLEDKYNKIDLRVICSSQADIHMMLFEENLQKNEIPSEHLYDCDWWVRKLKELA